MKEPYMEIKYLKYDKNTDWLAYQRKLPTALLDKAKQLSIKSPLVWPLGLTKADSPAKIASAIDACNEKRDGIIRFIESTSVGSVTKADAYEKAKAWLEARGVKQGSLLDVDPMNPEFDGVLSNALGIYENQHHEDWHRNYPDAERMPEALLSAVQQLLITPIGHEKYYLFSDAIERYKQYRSEQIRLNSQTDAQRKRDERAYLKDLKRLSDFMEFAGNQEFTSDNCNVSLRSYREVLMQKYPDTPATAKRHLEVPSAALRRFADEVATNVSIASLTIRGQKAKAKGRAVLDIETELPLVWAAAHDDSYDHFFRLHVFGIFSGSHASELVQTDVNKVFPDKGYYISGGSKRDHRSRPVIIVNRTHRELLLKFSEGASKEFTSVCGFRAEQTESNHAKLLKKELQRATGNPELTAYCLRHTGKHLGEVKGVSNLPAFDRIFGWQSSSVKDDYGRAGVYSNAMIQSYREITDKLLEGLEDHESPTPAVSVGKVVQLKRK
jgi:integrase